MLMIVLPPGSGKGIVGQIIKLLYPVNNHLMEQYKAARQAYGAKLARYKGLPPQERQAHRPPAKPAQNFILAPGNITSAKLIELLSVADDSYVLLICETEMDALGVASRSEHGLQLSTILRQAFHHEQISKAIKQDDEYVLIKSPRLSAILAGTPNQLPKLLHSNADGLVSRFLVLFENLPPVWKDTRPCAYCRPLDDHFLEIGEEFFLKILC